jgi:predicted nucleic acid-binding protein
VTAVDTSVAVAALASWHEAHESARRAAANALIPAHARIETYSVLTRLPPPHRLSGDAVAELVSAWFPPTETLAPSPRLSRGIVERCAALGLSGGAVYDALVGLTAAEAGETLLTRDDRAARTYTALDVAFETLC